ncbi:GNAT family N-acetyltransferase [Streptomyces sp. NPDC004041]|uniref:GNAT family N-acetyltransferase n=1 Tax=Streptomyces sp. NPDC004041 TaxID=3364688 RepID=UPI003695F80C
MTADVDSERSGAGPAEGPDEAPGRVRDRAPGAESGGYEVFRDDWGIPHLRAADALTLARAQGRATALDRAWQLETERHRVLGTSASHLGPEAVEWDRFVRRARIADTARRCFDRLAPETAAWVTAYVDGVNEGLAEGAGRTPEFAAVGLAPGRWEPWTPLGVWLSTHILFAGFPTKLWRDEVARRLGEDLMTLFATDGPGTAGSNGWLLTGARTASGAPLLAGDPHRFIEDPGVYQQIRLACPEFDVVGLAVPGIPGIAHFGHTGHVAWAITNAMADYQDLYRERLRRTPDGGVEALGPDGWYRAHAHTETIEVAGADPEQIEVIETDRGPVIIGSDPGTGEDTEEARPGAGGTAEDARSGPAEPAEGVRSARGEPARGVRPGGGEPVGDVRSGGGEPAAEGRSRTGGAAEGTFISLRYPPRVTGELGFDVLPALLRARTVADVDTALDRWVEPVNVVLAADTAGSTLHRVAGHVPVRPYANRLRVVPAEDPAYAWREGETVPLPRTEVDGSDDAGGPGGSAASGDPEGSAGPEDTGGCTESGASEGPDRPGGIAATANERGIAVTGNERGIAATGNARGIAVMANERGLAAPLGVEFAPPHRARRIGELLGAGSDWTPDAQAAVHTDTLLASSRPLLSLLARTSGLGPAAGRLRDRLLSWDRHMDADSTDATLYARLRTDVVHRLAAHPALQGVTGDDDPWRSPAYPALFRPWLAAVPRIGYALESLLTVGLLPDDDRVALVAAAAEAVAATAEETPPAPWGELHRLSPWQALPDLTSDGPDAEAIRPGVAGDHDCVLSTSSVPGITDLFARGPAARYVWDLARREDSRWAVPFGASGVPGSAHHRDQTPLWVRGALAPVVTDWNLLHRTSHHPEENPAMTVAEPVAPALRPAVHDQKIEGFGTVRLVPVDPAADAELLHGWVTEERARFWGMADHTREQVREIYAFVDSLPTHHAYLALRDGVPAALFQTYEPDADPVGECYDVQPGDFGVHLLIAPAEGAGAVKGYTEALLAAFIGYVFSDPAHLRVVVEPDARNDKAIARMVRVGFELGPEIRKPEKTARLAFLTRAALGLA